jgi:cellulose synthase/poly-beta-1,6-N-acetylglucosamine synthase-like glycosyltransferase
MYYWYLKTRWSARPWNIKVNEDFKPGVSIIVPTYNEADYVQRRLDNVLGQQYPSELVEVILVDSQSTDKTPEIARAWQRDHPTANVKIVEQSERKGKIFAISEALKWISRPVVIVGDADSIWDERAIQNAVKYFADPSVGALTASLRYYSGKQIGLENAYRGFYNVLRIGESKIHSTPLQSGVFQAFRAEFVERFVLGLYPGAEDCAMASYVAFSGYRAIQTDDVWAYEPLRGGYLGTKVRRAQHNVLNFMVTKKYVKKEGRYVKSVFDSIWSIEQYLYLFNPFLLMLSVLLISYGAIVLYNIAALVLLGLGFAVFVVSGTFRMWVLQQICVTVAAAKNGWTRPIMWNR